MIEYCLNVRVDGHAQCPKECIDRSRGSRKRSLKGLSSSVYVLVHCIEITDSSAYLRGNSKIALFDVVNNCLEIQVQYGESREKICWWEFGV